MSLSDLPFGALDPTNELSGTLMAYEFTLKNLVTTSAQCRTLEAEVFQAHTYMLWLLWEIRQKMAVLARDEAAGPIHQ